MKLWLLRPREGQAAWERWYDKAFGFVVRAKTEAEARKLAGENCGDEGDACWLDSAQSTCEELTRKGKSCVIIQDFHAA